MVREQLYLSRGAVEFGDREIWVAQCGQGDRLSLDRVRLARLSRRAASPGHELGRDTNDSTSCRQQIGLQTAGEMAAVLQREADVLELG